MAKDAMLYTNGKILISSVNDAESLHKGIRKLENYLFEENGVEAKFILDDTRQYPCYLVPAGVAWAAIDKALRPRVALKAIDEEIMLDPVKKEVDYRYMFLPEELEKMAGETNGLILRLQSEEQEKSSVMAGYAATIKSLKKQINDSARSQVDGYTDKQVLCQVRYNFADGAKYYVDANDPDNIIKSEPMDTKDYQLRIDTTREPMFNPEAGNAADGQGFLPFGDEDDDDDEKTPPAAEYDSSKIQFPENWDEGDKINYGINQISPEERKTMTGSEELIVLPEGTPILVEEPVDGYEVHTDPDYPNNDEEHFPDEDDDEHDDADNDGSVGALV